MPWAAAIPAVAGLVGGLLGSKGKKKEAERQRQFFRWLYDPNRINKSSAQLNPFLAYALGTQGSGQLGQMFGNNAFAQDLRKIAQGQDLSKYLLNQPLHEINRMGDQSMQRFQNLMGRNAASGGLGELFAMSNLASRNLNRARTMRDYGMWREGQRRNDINNLLGMWANTQGMTMQGANQQGANFINPPSSQSAWGGAMPFLAQAGADIFKAFQSPNSSGLSSLGQLGGQAGGSVMGGQGSTIQTGGNNPFNQGSNPFTFGLNPNQFQFGGA